MAGYQEDRAIKSWLYTTLYREFLLLRKQSRHLVELDAETLSDESAEAHSNERAIDSRTAVQTLAKMEEPHRSVLSLFYVDDLSYDDGISLRERASLDVSSRRRLRLPHGSEARRRDSGNLFDIVGKVIAPDSLISHKVSDDIRIPERWPE